MIYVKNGGVWQGRSCLRERFASSIIALGTGAQIIWPHHDSAYGAAILALNALSGLV